MTLSDSMTRGARSDLPHYHAQPSGVIACRAWVALGSNLGDRAGHLSRALRWLETLPKTRLVAKSPTFRTPAVGPPQPDYLNAVARLETQLEPVALLDALLTLERAAHRVREPGVHWGPRTLDLDLLHMTDGKGRALTIAHARLALPHPRLEERRFVLEPLARLDPELRLASGLRVRERLALLD